jgi:choline kinase
MPPFETSETVAIILAAGVGKRLAGTHWGPKVLLDFGGRSLIDRHLDALSKAGVSGISITVGYQAEVLRTELAGRAQSVNNPDYRQGSLISLWVQRDLLCSGRSVLLMDGDVLCDKRMIQRLVAAEGQAVLLVDRELEPGDEPVKVCFRGEVMVDFGKRPEHPHEWHGESVGFFKFSPMMAAALADACQAYIEAGQTGVEYEEAIRDLILGNPECFTYLDVSDLPWTEIDFPEDVEKARNLVLPALQS